MHRGQAECKHIYHHYKRCQAEGVDQQQFAHFCSESTEYILYFLSRFGYLGDCLAMDKALVGRRRKQERYRASGHNNSYKAQEDSHTEMSAVVAYKIYNSIRRFGRLGLTALLSATAWLGAYTVGRGAAAWLCLALGALAIVRR